MKKKALSMLLAFVLALSLMPSAALAETSVPQFTDVESGEWYYDAVQYTAQNEIMTGVSSDSFAPGALTTRAMLAAALCRLDGSDKPDKSVEFSDVSPSAWYYDPVEWAAVNGIISSAGDGTFRPDDNVTRQEAAVIFCQYAKYKGRSTESTGFSAYTDAASVEDGAANAMGWAVSSGLITGTGGSMLSPNEFATRAQTAAMLQRYTAGAALEKRTSDYVSQFIAGNFSDFYSDCNAQLQQSITEDQLLQSWNTIIQPIGAPNGSPVSVYSRQGGCDIVTSTVACTLYNIKVTVTYGSDGKPAGIWTSYAPKDPPEPQSTDEWEEVPVKVGEYELPGMLTLPKGVDNPPVVIMVQGSGSSDMNESIGTAPNRPFEDIAHGLAEQGVATLRYNKRTYQYPTGGGDTIEYETLDDAAAAVKLLCSNGRVDKDRIFLLGHSLGGMMAPEITAENNEIKGFISMAGSLRTLQDLMLDQSMAAIDAEISITDQQKNALLAQYKAEIEKTKTLDDGGTGYIMGVPTNYWKSLNDIDSAAIVKGLTVPMLILQGSADFQVYPDKDYKLWQTTLAGRGNVTFKLYDGLSHLFMPDQISANGVPDVSVYNAPNHVDPQVINDIAEWVNKQ